jgi:hydrogenase expression/formation protein HypC
MCLGIPMRIQAIDGLIARCEAKGVQREVSLLMLGADGIEVGDHVVVHLGYAIDKVTPQDAAAAWAIYDQLLAAEPSGGR